MSFINKIYAVIKKKILVVGIKLNLKIEYVESSRLNKTKIMTKINKIKYKLQLNGLMSTCQLF